MPLTPPAARHHYHTRRIECFGYAREDGLWDIEGHIVDTKTYGFTNTSRGTLEPGDPVHDMWVRLTITDEMEIVAVEAVTDAGPFTICGDITPAYQKLIGLRIVSGFTAGVKERLGGVRGCTHLTELLGPMGTVAYQTMVRHRNEQPKPGDTRGDDIHKRRPRHINTCHALASDGPVVAQHWPEYFTGDEVGKTVTDRS